MTHHLRRIVITGTLLAVGVALGVYWSQPKPVPVVVQAVERGDVQSIVSNTRAGTVKACRRARLSPAVGGLIARLPVKRGEQVKKDQLLLELWNHDIVAEIAFGEREAEASRARAREACVVATVARREADRLERLRSQNLASEEDTERATGNAEAREASCSAAREANRVSDARVAVTREALERTLLLAPFDGVVAEINGELGEFVTPSPPGIPTPPAVDLIDVGCLYISAPIDEVDSVSVKIGLPARITLDAFPGKTFEGRVRRVAPYVREVEKQARTVDVEADFVNPGDTPRIMPGYSADLEIILDTRSDVLRIPAEAVITNSAGRKQVLVLPPGDDRLQKRDIDTGLSNWKLTEVRSGLEIGDRVVLSVDREGVEDGALVSVED